MTMEKAFRKQMVDAEVDSLLGRLNSAYLDGLRQPEQVESQSDSDHPGKDQKPSTATPTEA